MKKLPKLELEIYVKNIETIYITGYGINISTEDGLWSISKTELDEEEIDYFFALTFIVILWCFCIEIS